MRKSRENYTKNAKRRNARKPAKVAKKTVRVQTLGYISKRVASDFVREWSFRDFRVGKSPCKFQQKKMVDFSPRIRHNQLEHTSGAKAKPHAPQASRGYGCLPHIRHYNHQHNNQNQHIGYHTADLECPLFIHTDFAAEMPQTFSKHLSAVKPAKRERIEYSKEQV